jgi:hypothetical protein
MKNYRRNRNPRWVEAVCMEANPHVRIGKEILGGDDHDDLSPNQFGRQRREPVKPTFGPPVFDRHVLALDIACVLQALAKSAHTFTIASGDWMLRNPITGVALCCARAASGHAAAPPSEAKNFRRPMWLAM